MVRFVMSLILVFSLIVIKNNYCIAQNWKLVWSDEFNDNSSPDTTKWSYEVGEVRNGEAQYYTKDRTKNARIEGGKLILEAHKEDYKGYKYTSASLHTLGKRHFLYGRYEIRVKVPKGIGTWPAIWMLGVNINEVNWPLCGEIDILENVGYDPQVVHANIHTEAYNHGKGTNKGNKLTLEKPWEEFHVYAMEWYPDRIDFFVDTTKYFTFKNDGKGNVETWPYDKPQYLLLNLAIGGGWGGRKGIDDALFPHQYLIDYVRVFENDELTGRK